jgi:hypothetical protein
MPGHSAAQVPNWYRSVSKIRLFETTRHDVEKFFPSKIVSSTKGAAGLSVEYDIGIGELDVVYSLGKCSEENKYDYPVREGIVTGVNVTLKKPTPLKKFGFDLEKFEVMESSDVVGLFTYANEQDGIYLTGSKTKLHGYELVPASAPDRFSCENVKNHKIEIKAILVRPSEDLSALDSEGQDEWHKALKQQAWLHPLNKIELARTSSTEVAKILGPPEYFDETFLGRELIKYYELAGGRVTVSYTGANCVSSDGKKVPKSVVEEVEFSPKKKIRFSSLKLPLHAFSVAEESDTPILIYSNSKRGVRIAVLNGLVHSIVFKLPDGAEIECKGNS